MPVIAGQVELEQPEHKREYFMERARHYSELSIELPKVSDPRYQKKEESKNMRMLIFVFAFVSLSPAFGESQDYRKMTESACFNPGNEEKQELCIKSVKLMLMNAAFAGYGEAACTAKIVKDKKSCEKHEKEYQEIVRYGMK